jgi:hypothetical protein
MILSNWDEKIDVKLKKLKKIPLDLRFETKVFL